MALVTGIATTLVSFTAVQLMLRGADLPAAGVGDPGVLAALAGGPLYLMLVGVTLLVPGLPGAIGDRFAWYWPITAGQAAYTVVPIEDMLAPRAGLAVLAAATAGIAIAGHTALRVRDV
ncbi:hypothetical protein [Actinomadura rugatobispora]|uniref:ABC transporter permease n=1 Tax=Actinomadura rugatobispora TaxID=1994 RepID=A0ABW0ZTE4_9ACTN